ncbi:hypothetical protein B1218_34550, partial [Pseudomonas ogarae]
ILDFVIENYQPMGEAMHAEIDELEHHVRCIALNERDMENRHSLRRDVSRVRRYCAPMVAITEALLNLCFAVRGNYRESHVARAQMGCDRGRSSGTSAGTPGPGSARCT